MAKGKVSSTDIKKALEKGRPPNIKKLFPNSKALIVSGKVVDRAMIAKGNAIAMAANGRNHTRVLDTLSYRAVLERGFALVRGAYERLRRRAAVVKSGEKLTITFADGEQAAIASGAPQANTTPRAKGAKGQGDLF